MGTTLSTYTSSKDNNFNLIRFIAASIVLFSHSYALALGSGETEPLRLLVGITGGSVAVDIFFISSGFLIASSYLARNNMLAFIWARVLRIYPALFVAVLFCLSIGAWFTTLSVSEFIARPETHKYFLKNITLFFGVEHKLPGVFEGASIRAINGSLWTLPYEVKMYALLAIFLYSVTLVSRWIKFVSVRNTILVLGVSAVALNIANHFLAVLPDKFVRLFAMFFIGATFFVWRDKIVLSAKLALPGFFILFLAGVNESSFYVIYALFLPYLIFFTAYVPAGEIRKFNRFGDYSYGIYIYAFPVQQVVAATVPGVSVMMMSLVAYPITLGLSMLSWHLREKRALRFKEAYTLLENFIQNRGLTRLFTR